MNVLVFFVDVIEKSGTLIILITLQNIKKKKKKFFGIDSKTVFF